MSDDLSRRFLAQAAEAGAGANMWKVGEALEMDRGATENLAMELMSQGLLQMVNLSGKIAITEEGARLAGGGLGGVAAPDLASALAGLEKAGSLGLAPGAAADFRVDLATLKEALKRSAPLEPVVQGCLNALDQALAGSSSPEAAQWRDRLAVQG